jgi:hypothetical protein
VDVYTDEDLGSKQSRLAASRFPRIQVDKDINSSYNDLGKDKDNDDPFQQFALSQTLAAVAFSNR